MRDQSRYVFSLQGDARKVAEEQTVLWRLAHEINPSVNAEWYGDILSIVGVDSKTNAVSNSPFRVYEPFTLEKPSAPYVHIRLTHMYSEPTNTGSIGQVPFGGDPNFLEETFFSRIEIISVTDNPITSYMLFYLCLTVIINSRVYLHSVDLGALDILDESGQVHKHEMSIGEASGNFFATPMYLRCRSDVRFPLLTGIKGINISDKICPIFTDAEPGDIEQ